MSKVYVFLADGCEEIEALTVVDILRRAKIDVTTVSVMGHPQIMGSHRIPIGADTVMEQIDPAGADLYVLPGGMPGTLHLGECRALTDLLKKAKAGGKKIAAICAAPSVLGDEGLLVGEKATCYPGMEGRLKGAQVITDQEVVRSGQITTSRGMGTAIPFALDLTAQLLDQKSADALSENIVFRCTQ